MLINMIVNDSQFCRTSAEHAHSGKYSWPEHVLPGRVMWHNYCKAIEITSYISTESLCVQPTSLCVQPTSLCVQPTSGFVTSSGRIA